MRRWGGVGQREEGLEADLQGGPDFGAQREAPFLFPSHQGSVCVALARSLSRSLAGSGHSRAAPHTSGSRIRGGGASADADGLV